MKSGTANTTLNCLNAERETPLNDGSRRTDIHDVVLDDRVQAAAKRLNQGSSYPLGQEGDESIDAARELNLSEYELKLVNHNRKKYP